MSAEAVDHNSIEERSPGILSPWIVWGLLLFVLIGAASIRLRLVDMPLERDEGEYAYAGQLMLQGIPPYQEAYNMKLPGTYAAYAVIMAVFGQTARGIHLGLILVSSATTLLIFLLGRKVFGDMCGIIAAAFFAVLSLSHSVLGLAAHATHFVTLFAVGGALLLWHALEKGRGLLFFASGLSFGLSFLMKQQAVFFLVFAGVFLLWDEWRKTPRNLRDVLFRIVLLGAGIVLPFLSACLILAAAGAFSRFWFWTFSYARQYAGINSLEQGLFNFRLALRSIFPVALFAWLMVGLALLRLLLRERNRPMFFLVGFALAAFATACPGLYFREHYFIPLLAAAGLLAGAGLQTFAADFRRPRWLVFIPWIVAAIALGDTVRKHSPMFFRLTPEQVSRGTYRANPFVEAPEIARYLEEHSPPGSRIAVMGSEPEIFFYSHRRSVTGYIYTYPLLEAHKYAVTMQEEMIAEIERGRPAFVVLVDIPFSWLPKPKSNLMILNWFQKYAEANLDLVGLVEVFTDRPATFRWGEKAIAVIPQSDFVLKVYRRKDVL